MTQSLTRLRRLLVTLAVVLGAGCATRAPSLASLPADDLYARGVTAYESRRWDEASRVLEYFVTQYIAGGRTLADEVAAGPLAQGRALHLMAFILDALAYLHRDFLEPGTPVEVVTGSGPTAATVQPRLR